MTLIIAIMRKKDGDSGLNTIAAMAHDGDLRGVTVYRSALIGVITDSSSDS